jgi:hypothetical protein
MIFIWLVPVGLVVLAVFGVVWPVENVRPLQVACADESSQRTRRMHNNESLPTGRAGKVL